MGIPKLQSITHKLRSVERTWVAFEAPQFRSSYGRQPFGVSHDLTEHPLFELSRLEELAEFLPDRRVEWNAAQLPLSVTPSGAPANGLSVVETLRSIHQCGSWVVLKHVQLDREYGQLLEECMADLEPSLRKQNLTASRPCGFIFVSSPGAITPCHLDPESNFLLQVRGSKVVSALPRNDERFVGMNELERFTVGGDRHVQLDESALAEAVPHELAPGEGLHVPLHAPHFVENGPAVSVSFSVSFQTESTDRERGVLWVNHHLRSLGLEPRPPRASTGADLTKVTLFKGLRRIRRAFRSSTGERSSLNTAPDHG